MSIVFLFFFLLCITFSSIKWVCIGYLGLFMTLCQKLLAFQYYLVCLVATLVLVSLSLSNKLVVVVLCIASCLLSLVYLLDVQNKLSSHVWLY